MNRVTLLILAAIIYLASCKRDDNQAPLAMQNCRLSSVTHWYGASGDSDVYMLHYNAGQLASVTRQGGGNWRSFSRNGNTIVFVQSTLPPAAAPDSVFLNNDGLIVRHRDRRSISSGLETITEYEYLGMEVQRGVLTRYENGIPVSSDTARYQWSGGNMTRMESSNAYIEYAYDTNAPIPPLGTDWLEAHDIVHYGAPVIQNKHLMSSITWSVNPAVPIIMTHSFDAAGKLVKTSYADGTAQGGYYFFGYACE